MSYIEYLCNYWHRAIGSKWGLLTQLKFIGVCRMWSTWACFDHISLIRNQNRALFFFKDSLFSKKYYIKISKFFPTGPQSFNLGKIH